MTPLGDRVLVSPIKEEEKTKAGIILPESQKMNNLGRVVIIGVKTKKIKVGDTVMYHDHVGVPHNYRGDDLLFLKEDSEIISII